MKRKLPNPEIERYQAYVAWCGRFRLVPAVLEVWRKTVATLPDFSYSREQLSLFRSRGCSVND